MGDMLTLTKFCFIPWKCFLLFCVITLIAACNIPAFGDAFDFGSSEFVMFNEIELDADQIKQLETVLNSLEKKKIFIFKKPAHQIKFSTGGESRFISIFEEEKFVFQGYYLDAWEDRMKDVKSKGYRLSGDLEDLITEFKSGS